MAETINGKDLKIPVSYLYSKSITVFTSVLLTKGLTVGTFYRICLCREFFISSLVITNSQTELQVFEPFYR